MKTIIIHQTTPPAWYPTLTDFCNKKGLKINTYHKKKFPFEVEGCLVYKLEKAK